MNRFGLACALSAALWASPAFAAGDILCMHPAGAAIGLLVDRPAFLKVNEAIIYVSDDVWTTSNEKAPRGTLISVGQAYEDDAMMLIDIADEDGAGLVARLRVLYAKQGDMRAAGGTLEIAGRGVWAVDCVER